MQTSVKEWRETRKTLLENTGAPGATAARRRLRENHVWIEAHGFVNAPGENYANKFNN